MGHCKLTDVPFGWYLHPLLVAIASIVTIFLVHINQETISEVGNAFKIGGLEMPPFIVLFLIMFFLIFSMGSLLRKRFLRAIVLYPLFIAAFLLASFLGVVIGRYTCVSNFASNWVPATTVILLYSYNEASQEELPMRKGIYVSTLTSFLMAGFIAVIIFFSYGLELNGLPRFQDTCFLEIVFSFLFHPVLVLFYFAHANFLLLYKQVHFRQRTPSDSKAFILIWIIGFLILICQGLFLQFGVYQLAKYSIVHQYPLKPSMGVELLTTRSSVSDHDFLLEQLDKTNWNKYRYRIDFDAIKSGKQYEPWEEKAIRHLRANDQRSKCRRQLEEIYHALPPGTTKDWLKRDFGDVADNKSDQP